MQEVVAAFCRRSGNARASGGFSATVRPQRSRVDQSAESQLDEGQAERARPSSALPLILYQFRAQLNRDRKGVGWSKPNRDRKGVGWSVEIITPQQRARRTAPLPAAPHPRMDFASRLAIARVCP